MSGLTEDLYNKTIYEATWYTCVNDLIGGWVVTTAPAESLASFPNTLEDGLVVCDTITEEAANMIAWQHNHAPEFDPTI